MCTIRLPFKSKPVWRGHGFVTLPVTLLVHTSEGNRIHVPFLIGTASLYASLPQMASGAKIAYGEPLSLAFPEFPDLVFEERDWIPVPRGIRERPEAIVQGKLGIVTLASITSRFVISSVEPDETALFGSLQLTLKQ